MPSSSALQKAVVGKLPSSKPTLQAEKPRTFAIRLRIENAALRLYLARRIEEVSVEDISEAAGISRRTFFRYCESRDDVLAGTFTRPFIRHVINLRARPIDEGLVEAWLNVIRGSESWDDPENVDLSQRVLREYPELRLRAMERAQKAITTHLIDVIRYRFERAGKSTTGIESIAECLVSLSKNTYEKWLLGNYEGQYVERLKEEICTLGNELRL